MKVVSFSPTDGIGGADRVAVALHEGLRARGMDATHAVEDARGMVRDVRVLRPTARATTTRALASRLRDAGHDTLARAARGVGEPSVAVSRFLGHQAGSLQGTWQLADDGDVDVLHIHNVHSSEFAIRALPALAQQAAIVATLHDMWWLTGHCAHSFACDRWLRGCGACPDLTIVPSIRRDATAYNWRVKEDIAARAAMTVVAPSLWLLERARRSLLHPSHFVHVPNGVDLAQFHPRRRTDARRRLGLAEDEVTLAFVGASARTNVFKDAATLIEALAQLRTRVTALVVGDDGANEDLDGSAAIRWLGRLQSDGVADVLAAADLYVHAARAENHPLAVLEALASGTPVVGSAVGGISEQIDPGVTGELVPPSDAAAMARAIDGLTSRPERLRALGAAARNDAERRFNVALMIDRYVTVYEEAIARRRHRRAP